jgi:glycosyltransferase involved in cell wall biosynthesis
MNIGVNARLLLSENMEGMARFTYETVCQMAIAHPEDKFYLFFDRKVSYDFGFPENIIRITVPLQARHPILWHIWFEYMIPYFIKKYKIDVFYSSDGYMSLRTKVPTVLVTHDLAYVHFKEHIPKFALWHYQHFIPKYHRKAKSIIAVSEYVKQDIILNFLIPKDKISVAYNAVKNIQDATNSTGLSADKWPEIKPEKPYFIYIGSLHPRKNILNLISAFNQFNKNENHRFNLVLVGRLAWKSGAIEEAIKNTSDVIHTGIVSETIKYQLLKDAVSLVYVSLFEGFGIPLLEAMQNGVPVITSNVTSMPEVAGDAALIVDPNDLDQISSAMNTFVNDASIRYEYIQRGNKRYKEFSWVKSAEIIYDRLKESCND